LSAWYPEVLAKRHHGPASSDAASPEESFLEESISPSVSLRKIFSGNGEGGQNDDQSLILFAAFLKAPKIT
jgi:hypothetical protein